MYNNSQQVETKAIPYIRSVIEEGEYDKHFDAFWKYFIKTWMGLYDPAYWNVNAVVHADAAESLLQNRTNNPLERFNRKFNDAFPQRTHMSHNLLRLLSDLVKTMSLTWTMLKQGVADYPHICLSRSTVFLMTITISNRVNLLYAAGIVE